MPEIESHVTVQKRAFYSPPWADLSIIGVAGSSGSGKSTLSQAIVRQLNLPWVVILSMVRTATDMTPQQFSFKSEQLMLGHQDSFYKTLTPEQSKMAFANEFDFDSPEVPFFLGCLR